MVFRILDVLIATVFAGCLVFWLWAELVFYQAVRAYIDQDPLHPTAPTLDGFPRPTKALARFWLGPAEKKQGVLSWDEKMAVVRRYRWTEVLFAGLALLVFLAGLWRFWQGDQGGLLSLSASSKRQASQPIAAIQLSISRHPLIADFSRTGRSLPETVDPYSSDPSQVDVRSKDLTSMDLSGRGSVLAFANFDSKTKWPDKDKMPPDFKPETVMETGKNPGLGLASVHAAGITGKGVGIAIIDQALLVDHAEYKAELRHYEEIHWPAQYPTATMHGAAVASIAVGKTVGVAPDADLYYIAEQHTSFEPPYDLDFIPLAQSIERVLQINQTLPKENKIRVISISRGWAPTDRGYAEVTRAVNKAKSQGVFVVSSSVAQTHGLSFHGLGRDPLASPEKPESYGPGSWWAKDFYDGRYPNVERGDVLLVPMDSRTTASPTGTEDYVFYRSGGWSWSIPYIAGLYALACQVDPKVTPDSFWDAALATGDTVDIDAGGRVVHMGRVVNPAALIKRLSK